MADEQHDAERSAGAETRPMDAVVDGAATEAGKAATDASTVEAPRWSARAAVRPRTVPASPTHPGSGYGGWGTEERGEPYESGAYVADPYAGRSWLTPVLIALIVALLLAVLGIGGYLIFRETGGGTVPAPAVSPVPTVPASAQPSPSPSVPPSPSASPSESVSVPAGIVAVPPLVGLSVGDAQQALAAVGLSAVVVERPDASARPGTVLASDPPAGALIRPGSSVTLMVAAERAPSAPASGQPRPSASRDTDDEGD